MFILAVVTAGIVADYEKEILTIGLYVAYRCI